jgi:hypothetical protein
LDWNMENHLENCEYMEFSKKTSFVTFVEINIFKGIVSRKLIIINRYFHFPYMH